VPGAAERRRQSVRYSIRMLAPLAVGVVLLSLCGCDPGFTYVLPGAPRVNDDGARYVVDVGGGVLARFYSSVFIKSGHVEIEVLNQDKTPLTFTAASPIVSDADGRSLEVRGCLFQKETSPTTRIDAPSGDEIGKGQSARIMCGFPVEIRRSLFSSPYPPQSKRVTFLQPGFSKAGRALDIHATMVAE
jgi:hypothetical protein